MSNEGGFQRVFDVSPLPSLLLAPKNRGYTILRANRGFKKWFSSSEEDISGKYFEETLESQLNRKQMAELKAALDHVEKSGLSYTLPHSLRIPSSTAPFKEWFQVEIAPVLNAENQVSAIIQTFLPQTIPANEEELLLSSMKLAKVGYWELDLRKNFLNWSEVVYELHEVGPDFIPELHLAIDFIKEEQDRREIGKLIAEAIEQNKPFDVELKILTAKGNERWLRTTGFTEMEEGKMVRIYGTTQDITERKSVEERLQNITDNVPGVVFRYTLYADGKDELSFVSKGAEKLWGISAEKAMADNRLVWDQFQKEDLLPHQKSFREAAKAGEMWSNEWKVNHPDGSVRWHRGVGIAQMMDDGSIQWDAIITDVTRERKMHLALEKSEQAYKSLLEHNPDAIYSFDLEGNFLSVNRASAKLSEGTMEDLLSMTFIPLIPKEDQERVYQNFIEASKGETLNYDTGFITLKGNKRIINVTNMPMMVNGEVIGVYGIAKDITEKRKLEEQVTFEKDLSDSIIANLPGLFFLYDKQGKFHRWNKEMEVITGYTGEEISQMVPLDFFPERHKERTASAIQKNFEEGKGRLEADLLLKSGKCLPYFFTGGLIRFKGEDCILGFGINMSDQKQAEVALKEAKMLYQTLVQTINGVVWEADPNTSRFKYISPQVEEILGFSSEKWMQDTDFWQKQIHPDDRPGSVHFYREQVKLGKNHQFEYRIFHRDGHLIWMKDVVTVVMENGHPSRVFGLKLDITARKNAEAAALKNREALQKIMDQSIDVICTVDGDGCFRSVSNASRELWGRAPEELIGQPFSKFVHKDYLQASQSAAEKIMSGVNLTNFENCFLHQSGNAIPMIWSAKWDEKEQIMYAVGRDGTQKKEAEKQLQLSEKRFKKLVQDGADLIAILDREGIYRYVSPTSGSVLGLAPEEFIGKSAFRYIHEKDREWVMSQFSRLEQVKRIHVAPFRFRNKNGNWRWMETTVTNMFDEPTVRGIVANSRDVTEKKILTDIENLEKSVLEMNSIGDYSLQEIIDFYLMGIESLNEGMLCSVMKLKGDRLYDWSSGRLPKGFIQSMDGQQIGGEVGVCGAAVISKKRVLIENIKQNENWAYFRSMALENGLKACWANPIVDSHQQLLGVFSIYYRQPKAPTSLEENTITRATNILQVLIENRSKREDLKKSNQRYELASKATNEAIYEWDIENDHIEWGEGFKRMFGFDINKEKFPLKKWSEQLHPDDQGQVLDSLSAVLEDTDQILWVQRYRFKAGNGKYAHILENGYIVRDSQGKAQRMIGAMRDITQQIEFEVSLQKLNRNLETHVKELAATNAELEQFAYVASHDLQEPLRMVSSFLTNLDKKYGDQLDERAQKYIYYAVDGAKRMRQIVLDLLEFSKVGKCDGHLVELSIQEVIDDIRALYQRQIKEKQATIIAHNMPVLVTYGAPIHQLFQNLISNSLKYARKKEPMVVKVSAEESDSHWKFAVSDNGIGIAPEYYEKIFMIFKRLHSRDEYSGTGLGLAICKKIVENLGGEIWVDSELGKGTTFYFTIKKIV